MKRFTTLLVAASFTASCINYTGLEGDGSDYTKPQALGAAVRADAGGGSCTPQCPSTCRTSSVGDGCGGTCPANCATSCSGGLCQAGGGGTSDASTATEAGACQADGLTTCSAATCDDGTSAAASLGASSLDCQLRGSGSNWATAMGYCAGLGSGWRLASKGEALKIASSPNVCRTPLSGSWGTWTRTCAGAGLAWYVDYYRYTYQDSVGRSYGRYGFYALCVR